MGFLKKFFSFEGYVDDIRRIDELEGEKAIRQHAVDRNASDAEECAERIIVIDNELSVLRSKAN